MWTPKSDWTKTTIIIDKTARDKLNNVSVVFWWIKMSNNSQKIEALIEMYNRWELKI